LILRSYKIQNCSSQTRENIRIGVTHKIGVLVI